MRFLLSAVAALLLVSACGGGDPTAESGAKSELLPKAQQVQAAGTTYYIRTDGGSATQCTGKADLPYPGSGTQQACAWRSPHDALPATDIPRIAGGDTLVIAAGEYQVGWGAPGAQQGRCYAGGKYDCHLAAIPSGLSPSQPTRILGQGHDGQCSAPPKLWGTERVQAVLNLAKSSNVEISCLDITDKSVCVGSHEDASLRCVRGDASSYGAYADAGIRAYQSSNVQLRDVTVHGLAYHGIHAGGISNWTLERVRLLRNGYAGWDGDLSGVPGASTSSNSGTLTFRKVEIAWNGCAENPQTGEAVGCYAQQNGGYGDGMGTALTGGKWLLEDVSVHHNTSDGLDLLYADGQPGTHVTLNRVHAYSNAGNQVKINGNATITNSVIVGDCGFFYREEQKYPYMVEGDHCRAGGTALALALQSNSRVDVTHNTITGEGDILVFHSARTDRAGNPLDDTGAQILMRNNILHGQTDLTGGGGELVAAHYWEHTKAATRYENNLVFNVKGGQCPAGSVCSDPRLANGALQGFDPRLLAGSAARDKVAPIPQLTTDFLGKPRVAGAAADIGAVEAQGSTDTPACQRARPTMTLAQPPAPVVPGASLTLNLSLKNTDSGGCEATTFGLASIVPQGWTGQLDSQRVTLAPGAQAALRLTLKTPATANGVYTVPVTGSSPQGEPHAAQAQAVVQVRASDGGGGGGTLSGGVVTDKVYYKPGEQVMIGALVKLNGKPRRGAAADFLIEGPNGIRWTARAQTDANGMAWSSYHLGTGRQVEGQYFIYVTGSYQTAKAFRERNRFQVASGN